MVVGLPWELVAAMSSASVGFAHVVSFAVEISESGDGGYGGRENGVAIVIVADKALEAGGATETMC